MDDDQDFNDLKDIPELSSDTLDAAAMAIRCGFFVDSSQPWIEGFLTNSMISLRDLPIRRFHSSKSESLDHKTRIDFTKSIASEWDHFASRLSHKFEMENLNCFHTDESQSKQ